MFVHGYSDDSSALMSLEVNMVHLICGELYLDVILDVDTEELVASMSMTILAMCVLLMQAEDYEHIIPCAGIEGV